MTSPADAKVELVARALCRSVDAFVDPDAVTLCQDTLLVRGEGAKEWERYVPEARAAIAALEASPTEPHAVSCPARYRRNDDCSCGYTAVRLCELHRFSDGTDQRLRAIANRLTPTAEARQEIERLKHDVARQMTIANIECNEAEELRRILQVARPYISDRAGAGIIGAIDAALGKQSADGDKP